MISLDRVQRFLEVCRRAWLTLSLDRVRRYSVFYYGCSYYETTNYDSSKLSPEYIRLFECEAPACDVYNMLEMKVPDKDGLSLYNALPDALRYSVATLAISYLR